MEDPTPLRAVHTTNFPTLLRQLGVSLLVTTYQAGKLVLVREEGDHLNTHFRAFQAPMGMALAGDRMAVGTRIQVWEFVDVPAVTSRLDPPGRHDACFLPRSCHVTGNIQIHEMAWGTGGELWVVNTRFSCLCTLDRSASFTPRWRPTFVTALEPTDRCHLNGLGMRDGRPRYVTALGRDRRADGLAGEQGQGRNPDRPRLGRGDHPGAVDAPFAEVAHGPALGLRVGRGTLGYIDMDGGKYEPIAEVPGFTRGLDFAGNFAFVGLPQVRESAVFSGIPITERLTAEGRTCGVCAIDLRSGQVVGLLRFETAVQEVFAVTVLPGRRYPDLINDDEKLLENSFMVPDAALADVPASPLRASRSDPWGGGVVEESSVSRTVVHDDLKPQILHQKERQ